ncbi:hypothetical protein AAZX31_06G297000 [Glycine max]|uniref:QWRF motif-containing protein 7 n=1 Tax=Glycine max TaxID=3847 RepID=K7KYK0_SOYBN|nr:QWRF motif-containing protein 7 isoform X2 [Glycine max]KAH1128496.1 hypothetical protein GYH30_016851 [Glycine max]KRH56337.1 hypothetical protein GLYMA_06G318000v4 [Glycine max]
MDKTASTLSGRHNLTELPPSPRLVRSRSGSSPAAAITTPERSSHRLSSSQRFTITSIQRSKSTSRTRTTNNERNNINLNPTLTTSVSSKPKNNRVQEKKSRDDGFGKFLQRGVSPDNINVGASKRSTSKSPSAWALSPGRWSLGSPIWSQPPAKTNGSDNGNNDSSVGGGVTKVLKYFKQRKVSSVQEEEYHRFRILHNTLLQWRFINARAEVAMANVKNIAEIKLFSVWLRALMLRKITIQKRIELRKVKQLVKLYQILDGQLYLLTEWAQLERRNQESVARLTRKLSALSTILPLTHTVKVDTESVFEALNTAAKVMESIEPLMAKYQTKKVERILYQITELTTTLKQEEEYLQKLLGLVPVISTLLENEKSIRVHLIQTRSNTINYICM